MGRRRPLPQRAYTPDHIKIHEMQAAENGALWLGAFCAIAAFLGLIVLLSVLHALSGATFIASACGGFGLGVIVYFLRRPTRKQPPQTTRPVDVTPTIDSIYKD